MINFEHNPTFVNSTLKVTAKEDIDPNKELASENLQNKTIDQLLQEQNEENKE